jgi:hypothetical protein
MLQVAVNTTTPSTTGEAGRYTPAGCQDQKRVSLLGRDGRERLVT